MSRRNLVLFVTAFLGCFSSPVRAGLLTYDPLTISPGTAGAANPTIVVGNGTVGYAVDNQQQPILPNGVATAGNDGYQILNFTYTVTAKANPRTGQVGPIQIDWLTQERFSSGVATNITVNITGMMNINLNAGKLSGTVAGLVNSNINSTVDITFPPPPIGQTVINGPVNNLMIPWDMSAVKMNVAPSPTNTLEMYTSLAWIPVNVGDTLLITGNYTVTGSAVAVPEPCSLVLAAVAAGVVIPGALRRCRRTTQR
jgi:hypothetical protein